MTLSLGSKVPFGTLPSIISVSTKAPPLTGVTTATINAPATITTGNLLLMITSGSNTATPSGWTAGASFPASGNSPQIYTFKKIATASEPSTYTVTPGTSTDAMQVGILNILGTHTINSTFSKYTSTAATTIGTAAVSIPSVLNCLPIAVSTIQQLNLSNAGNPTGLTGGWTGRFLVDAQDAGNFGTIGNNNGYNALYVASGPLTTSTSTAVTAGWTWAGGSSNFTGTSMMLFVS
jgi:hypothetical protein